MRRVFNHDLLLIVDSDGFRVATIRSSGDGKATVIGGLGGRTVDVEWEVGEFLNLLGLSTSAEDEETAGEADSEKDQDDESDEEFGHGWGHGIGTAARVVSDDESGNYGHC